MTLEPSLTNSHPVATPFACPECGCEISLTAEYCACSGCGELFPVKDGIPQVFDRPEPDTLCPLTLHEIERALAQHPDLRGWRLQLVGRHTARASEILEFKRTSQVCMPRLMLKHRTRSLSRQASAEHVRQEFRSLQELWYRSDAAFRATLPRPVALLPEIGAALFERVPGISLTNVLKLQANSVTGPLRRNEICRIAADIGRWLRKLHALNYSSPVPQATTAYLANLAYWLRKAKDQGLDRATAAAVWDAAARSAFEARDQRVLCTGAHGDFIPQNILVQRNAVAVIDFESFRRPAPIYEDLGFFVAHCHLMTHRWLYSASVANDMAAAFLEAYGENLRADLLDLYVLKAMATMFADQYAPRSLAWKYAERLRRIKSGLALVDLGVAAVRTR